MAEAVPVEDFVWCADCQEPHTFFDGDLMFIGVDRSQLACQKAERVTSLPQDWERKYEAHEVHEFPVGLRGGLKRTGYDLYLLDPPVDPAVHRPMYYLET